MHKKIALVTGASRGLGYQVAKLLATSNVHVLGLARTIGGLENLSDEINSLKGSSTMIPLDLTNDLDLESLAKNIFERWNKVDFLIHAASIASPMAPVSSVSLKDFDHSLTVNTRATLKLIQVIDPLIRLSKNGMAIFVDDLIDGKFLSTYSSSKAASRSIIYSYQKESERIGVKVSIFNPSPMPTSLRARFYPGETRTHLSSCESQAVKLIELFEL